MRNRGGADLITTAEAASILHYSIQWVNKLAARGDLPVAKKLPRATGAYLFDRAEIERIASERVSA